MPFQVRRLCGVLGVSDRPQHTVGETEQAPAVRTAPSAVAGTDPSSNITGVPPTTPRGHASPHAEPSGYIPAGQPTHRTYPHHDKRHSCHRAIVDGNDVKYGIGGNNKSVTYRFYIPLKRTTPPPPPPKLSFPRRPTDCCSGTLNAPETRQGDFIIFPARPDSSPASSISMRASACSPILGFNGRIRFRSWERYRSACCRI